MIYDVPTFSGVATQRQLADGKELKKFLDREVF
jgi:hypothetical protein